jgi:hypothetical protein
MTIYKKLNEARKQFHAKQLKKSGKNAFAGYSYFELGDFVLPAMEIFETVGLCGIVSFTKELATLTIVDVEDGTNFVITSPMGTANLKGCHEIQNIGACETYQRRYLWMAAYEVLEHDSIDASEGVAKPKADLNSVARLVAGIQEAESIESLKTLYINACKLVTNDPLALKSLEFAKDKRKQELAKC